MHIALIIKGHDNGYGHFHARVGHIDRHQDAALPSAEQRRTQDGVKLASVVDGVAVGIVCDLAENVAKLVILGDQLAAVFKIFDFFTAVSEIAVLVFEYSVLHFVSQYIVFKGLLV